jgi:hypothetical protein
MFMQSLFNTSKLLILALIIFATASLAKASETMTASAQDWKCEKTELATSGAFLDISYKDITAKVKTNALVSVLNAIGQEGMAGGYLDGDTKTSCTATVSVLKISPETSESFQGMILRINGSCSNYDNYEATRTLQAQVMRHLIEVLSEIEDLKIDPAWDVCPKTGGEGHGGVTGSN